MSVGWDAFIVRPRPIEQPPPPVAILLIPFLENPMKTCNPAVVPRLRVWDSFRAKLGRKAPVEEVAGGPGGPGGRQAFTSPLMAVLDADGDGDALRQGDRECLDRPQDPR